MFSKRVLTVACALLVCLALVSQAQPPNLALNGTATQSTMGWGGVAENAINGNTGDFTHTAADDADKWWELDLGEDADLSRILIYNRASCCGERLVGAVLKVMDADRNEIYVSEAVAAAVTGDVHTYDNDGAGFTAARFIRVEGGTDFLSMGEVQALGFYPFAYGPTPAVGAEDVNDTTSLQWEAADGAASYNVYISADAIIDDADLAGEVTDPQIQPAEALTPGTLYSWRVDAVDAGGAVSEGPVWTFTTLGWEAHYPSPTDGGLWIKTEGIVLGWTVGKDAILHNVYFGMDEALVAARDASTAIRSMSLANTVELDALDASTTYYWAVDEWAASGTVYAGPVWSFTTYNPDEGGAIAEYWANRNLEGEPDVVTTESEINWNFNNDRDSSPHPDIPIDNFSCRWTAELTIPVTGTYILYEASDDGSRMFLNGEQVAAGWWDRGTTEDTTGPLELVAGERYLLVMEMYENGGGATAYLRWEGPGIPKQIIPQGALQLPQMAYGLTPDNAVDTDALPVLSWKAGEGALAHSVYFSADKDLVDASDPSVLLASTDATSVTIDTPLDRGTTYYWKVDEVQADGTVIPGYVADLRTADANTDSWAAVAATAEPGFQATHVTNGVYDIGDFSGDITYEFIVLSNPDETAASMALMGEMFNNKAGIKYEQWNNTGTYGATLFGVVDLDSGVATAPGEYTHLAFVSSEDAATTTLYVNGEEAGSMDAAITLNGIVGIGRAIRDAEGVGIVDDFDGIIFAVAVYDTALDAAAIEKNANAYFQPMAIADPDLLIHYTFESGAGRTVIDQSGHGNIAQFFGTPEWVEGVEGGGLALVLEDVDYIQTTAPLGITSNTITVTGWVTHDELPAGWSGILTHRGSGNLGLQHDGTELRYMWGPDLYWSFSSGLPLPVGEWYFAALAIAPEQATLYLNGTEQAATNVAPHDPVLFDSLIRVGRDHTDGRIMTSTIDDVRLYNKTLTDVEILNVMLGLVDVTAADDEVLGVPNDGDWPGGEYPGLAIDGDTGTKFLHFKGETEPTGIQVAPAMGATIVTGMTLTTANDAVERDPTSFEIYGSNESIEGPYELIAAGDIVDFMGEEAWPRFTMNATPILFENTVGYAFYQVLFPTVRDAASANSMQIAEIELLGELAPLYVEDFEGFEVGTDLHNVDGWEGWDGDAGAGAPVSDAFASSGSNSVEVIGSADLVNMVSVTGGSITLTIQQYIPSGTSGETYFILMSQYAPNAWSSVGPAFNLGSGQIGGDQGTIVYDEWVELKFDIDLDGNTVDSYYNGELLSSGQWSDAGHNTLQAIDLWANGASSIYYDDIVISAK